MPALAPILRDLLARDVPVVLLSVVEAKGSTPRGAGSSMLVTTDATFGTIGGGQLEWEAIGGARDLLRGQSAATTMRIALGPSVGQCCGGRVTLKLCRAGAAELASLESAEAAEGATLPIVLLFGAGHVGKALARALAPLPLKIRWIDGRGDEFPNPPLDGPEVVVTERALAEVERAPAGAAYLVLTHSHALDSLICAAVLQRGDFAYLGLIGSRTKRARFERGFRELGIADHQIARLVCPIGGDQLRDKRPAVIAALVAAQLLHVLIGPAVQGSPQDAGKAA